MNLARRLPVGFRVRDALDARSAEQLASAGQKLDLALPLEDVNAGKAGRARAAQARAERQKQLGDALLLASPLVESSAYDLQVLTVLMRLSIEAEGIDGSREALEVLGRVLNDGWSDLDASLAGRPDRERDKQRRKWGRYVDAVLDQMYLWLARERERDEPALSERLQPVAAEWSAALEAVERGARHAALPIARYGALERLVRDLSRRRVAAPEPTEAADLARIDGRTTSAPRTGDASTDPVLDARLERPGGPLPSSTSLRVSERFWELERRLTAFAQLLERGQYEKASIVEADLRQSLQQFDVAAYFPGLFARYFEGCAEHAEQLYEQGPAEGTRRAAALAELYRTDLERFLEFLEKPGSIPAPSR